MNVQAIVLRVYHTRGMKVMILFNPISGPGRSTAAAQELATALAAAGHVAVCTPTRLDPTPSWLDEGMQQVDVVVVAGGDGAVRMASAAALRTQKPVYHFPCGTENLFAREFGMTRDPQRLLNALARGNAQRVDVGTVNGRIFLLMVSIGYDAEVVHDLASRRGKSISHWTYLRPMLSQLWRWRPCDLEVTVDGQRLANSSPGFVVVANSRQYCWRLNPAGKASMSDGLLDVALFPARGRRDLMRWAVLCRLQRHLDHPRLVYARGRTVDIACACPQKYQLDGDPPELIGDERVMGEDGRWRLSIWLRPAALPVLLP